MDQREVRELSASLEYNKKNKHATNKIKIKKLKVSLSSTLASSFDFYRCTHTSLYISCCWLNVASFVCLVV